MDNPFEILANLQDRIPPEKLKAYDIDWFLILRIIGGDLNSIVELSNRLIEDMDINKRLPVGRKTGVVTTSDAKALINAMFKGCSIFGSPPSAPLVKLNEILLGADAKPRAASKEPAKKAWLS